MPQACYALSDNELGLGVEEMETKKSLLASVPLLVTDCAGHLHDLKGLEDTFLKMGLELRLTDYFTKLSLGQM